MKINDTINIIKAQAEEGRTIYIYGAGRKGIALLHILKSVGISVNGFVVSNSSENKEWESGLRVTDIHDLNRGNDECFLP